MAARAVLALLLLASADGERLQQLARRDAGDVFTLLGNECGTVPCTEHGASADADKCTCACPQRAPLFREDRELCVEDLPECSLATFGTGVGVQRIPFVYLPLKGQIIHPSREITFQNVKTPICAVSGAQFLTRKGFLDLRNTLDADVPFNLFRDEGRTFLQWSGEDEMRTRMAGRVIVVTLLCRDVFATPTSPLDLRGVFTPCVAFRVQGSPLRYGTNVTEVQFASNAQTAEASVATGLTVTEYVAIGISSLLLGLIYVASVFLYLHIRKRRKAASEDSSTSNKRLKGLKKKDGSAITERDIIRINNERVQIPLALGQDDGVIKKNPLLNMSRQFHDSKNSFPSDSGSNISDSEDFPDGNKRSEDNTINNPITSAVVHREFKFKKDDVSHRDESSIERLPDEHVSIVETTDDREIARPVGTTRRKLYFNPAYFEPQLMAEPPPAALEFLVKIREVISIAKHKMAQKRFQPILNEIPEEETYPSTRNSIELYQGLGSQRSGSAVSLKRENSRKRSINCVGCPGCKSDSSEAQNFIKYNMPSCSNCMGNKGDKQNSIRQWLENIPTGKQQLFYNDFLPNTNQNGLINSLQSLPIPVSRCKLKKQNSFSPSHALHSAENFSKHRRASTMSVRSEPPLRSYNIPLPEFESLHYARNDFASYVQTVSKTNDIRPIGLCDYRTGSLRCNAIANHRRHKLITNKNALPDMVHDAIALDNCSKSYTQSSSDEERYNQAPNANDTLSRNNSESPSAKDYETDSLERNTMNKKSDTPSADYTDDVPSSQASPSLSNALPLEEELTMRNAIYKHNSSNSNTPSPHRDIFIDHNQFEMTDGRKVKTLKKIEHNTNTKDEGTDYSLVSEVYVNNYNFGSMPSSPTGSECSIGSRKHISNLDPNDEKPGCLTIEVKDPPENYIKIHESDDFEPDTLDRKHAKRKEHENVQFSRKDLLRSIDNEGSAKQCILLRSSGTFTKTSNKIDYSPKFNSVRNDIEHRTFERPKLSPALFNGFKSDEATDDTLDDATDWQTEEGRILTLELRHSKRQRQSTPPTIKQIKTLPRPDVLPPLPPTGECPIYEQPAFPPRRVDSEKLPIGNHAKNVIDRSLSPRKFLIEPNARRNSNPHDLQSGPSCSPTRASVESQSLEQLNLTSSQNIARITGDISRNSSRRTQGKGKTPAGGGGNEINSNTFVKGTKSDGVTKSRFRRKKGLSIEDSGYLSSDSTSSRQMPRKIVVAKIVSCSESDDTENEARSESGAESVETHSVYFGSFRKHQTGDNNTYINNIKSARDIVRK